MIITNGYNVYPSYIEEVLSKNKYIFQSAVIGIPHPYKGEVGKCFIVLKEGLKPTLEIKKSITNCLNLKNFINEIIIDLCEYHTFFYKELFSSFFR